MDPTITTIITSAAVAIVTAGLTYLSQRDTLQQQIGDALHRRLNEENEHLRDEIAALKAELASVRTLLETREHETDAMRVTLAEAIRQQELLKSGVKRLLAQLKRLGIKPDWTFPEGMEHDASGQ